MAAGARLQAPRAAKDKTLIAAEEAAIEEAKAKALEDAKLDAEDHGFNHIPMPALPPDEVVPPAKNLPTDPASVEFYTNIMTTKLTHIKKLSLEEIQTGDNPRVVQKAIPTSKKLGRNVFKDPKDPVPTSYRAQDLVRLLLHHNICLREFIAEGADPEGKRIHDMHEKIKLHWLDLKGILSQQLPGTKKQREQMAEAIVEEVIGKDRAQAEGGRHHDTRVRRTGLFRHRRRA